MTSPYRTPHPPTVERVRLPRWCRAVLCAVGLHIDERAHHGCEFVDCVTVRCAACGRVADP